MSESRRALTVRLPAEIYARVKDEAAQSGRSLSNVGCLLIVMGLLGAAPTVDDNEAIETYLR